MKSSNGRIDLGLCTNRLHPMLEFWQTKVGLQFDHVLPVRRGQKQCRHDALGSVIKINLCVPKTLNSTIVVMKSAQDGT
jgi:hypothetical protein